MGGRGSGSRNGSREFVFGLQVEGEELAVRIKTGRKPVKANKEWRYSLRSEKKKLH